MTGIIKLGLGVAAGYAVARVIEGQAVGLSPMDVLRPDVIFEPIINIRRNTGTATEQARYGVTMPVNPAYLPPQ